MSVTAVTMAPAAMLAASAIAEAEGLTITGTTLIGGYANTIIKLEPLPLVARVATAAGEIRSGANWLRREIGITEYLSRSAVRAVQPATLLHPGPHEQNGLALSFWKFYEIEPGSSAPRELGSLLHDLHRELANYPAELPVLAPLAETWSLLDSPHTSALSVEARRIVTRTTDWVRGALDSCQMEHRPLHGDAHHGNVWRTSAGLIWADFEDTHAGPIEWDLACMIASSVVLGTGGAATEALSGYAAKYDPELLKLMVQARTLQALGWALVATPNPTSSPRFRRRLQWLAKL